MLWTDKARKYLLKYWNIDNLKDKQIEIINELLLGNDVIGLLPTGYGKSMCYILPPLIIKKVVFIISPLISLMEDQIDKLKKKKIKCTALHGNNMNKYSEVQEILKGNIKIVYMSPEYLYNNGIELAQELINNNNFGFLAIDECHCINSWGNDFRPEYNKISIFRDKFSDIPIMAITATATKIICQDIEKTLKLNNPQIIYTSFDRPNLYIKVEKLPKKNNKEIKKSEFIVNNIIMHYINKYNNDKIIIYFNSRKDTEDISFYINKYTKKNISSFYHAGLSNNNRDDILNKFINNNVKIIISTIAFGMGIDQIIKCVLIFGCPSSIEEYYQQIGRGGRDGEYCETVLYYDYSQYIISQKKLIEIKNQNLYNNKKNNLNEINKLVDITTCRRKYILEYFNEKCTFFTCNNCDNCKEQELIDMTNEFKPIIFNNNFIKKIIENISKLYLIDNIKDLKLYDLINNWKQYILDNNINIINENLKFKIPKYYIKNNDDIYNKYDKYLT